MFTARAQTHAVILDDIPDPETLSARRPEAELPEGRVPAVGRAEDGVVDAIPAGIGEEGGHLLGGAFWVRGGRGWGAWRLFAFLWRLRAAGGRGRVLDGAGVAVGAHAGAAGRFGAFLVDRALPHAIEGVQVPVLHLGFGAFFRVRGVFRARLAQGVDFLLRGVLGPEGAHEVGGFGGDDADGFGAAVQVYFGHGRLVRVLYAAVETVVRGLEGHLDKGVRGEAHGGHEVLAIPREFEGLEFVLLDQIREPGFGEPERGGEFGEHVPFQLVGRGADVAEGVGVAF